MPSDPRDPNAGRVPPLAASAGQPQPGGDWDGRFDRRKPTTAELAVPWLIGIILLLTGVVVLLIVLLLNEDDPAIGRRARPTVTVGGTTAPVATAQPDATATGTPAPIGGPATTPRPSTAPSTDPFPFGETELAFLARAEPLAPITVVRDDFATDAAATVLAQAAEGIPAHDWAPDGSLGVGIVAGIAVVVEPGGEPRRLADNVAAVAFGGDAATVYAVRVREQGDSETATVIGLEVATGEERLITEVTYPNPSLSFATSVEEAQFADDGGPIRLVWLADDRLALVVAQGPTLAIDPADGAQTSLDSPPALWSPDGGLRVTLAQTGGTTTLTVLDDNDDALGTASVSGAVSHLRWAPRGDRVVFTVGVGTADGGVRQDLYVWTVSGGSAPTALTANGASFGAEWLGAKEFWRA